MWKPQKKEIYSWKNVQIARGYEKVLATWQGLYGEVSWNDLVHENLTEKIQAESGMRKWVSEGVTVYQFAKGYQHVLREHRLAVIPPEGEKVCRGEMRSDRFYIHIYQTKINRSGGDMRSLNSREMAEVLSRDFGNS